MTDQGTIVRSAKHATFVVEREFDASPPRVFAAWADIEARARWAVPAGDEIIFSESDFRVGGRDVGRCGPAGNPMFVIETYYRDIVPATRIVVTERVSSASALLAVALMTVEFKPAGTKTGLLLTGQMVALDGSDIAEGSEAGWAEVLGNLARELQSRAGPDDARINVR